MVIFPQNPNKGHSLACWWGGYGVWAHSQIYSHNLLLSQCMWCHVIIAVKQSGKTFTGLKYNLLLSFNIVSDVFRSFIPNEITFTEHCYIQWISKLPKLWNPQIKAVPGKFHGSLRHSKCNCLQDRANFQRSQAWQIVLIFNIAIDHVIRRSHSSLFNSCNMMCMLHDIHSHDTQRHKWGSMVIASIEWFFDYCLQGWGWGWGWGNEIILILLCTLFREKIAIFESCCIAEHRSWENVDMFTGWIWNFGLLVNFVKYMMRSLRLFLSEAIFIS